MEFGTPALLAIAEGIATSPFLDQDNLASTLATLQTSFYTLRGELPVDVPDEEIIEALRGCLDAWGDARAVATMPTAEVMAFSRGYVRATEQADSTYRIVDDEGRAYSFDQADWDYDEQVAGWNGEGWADELDD